MSALIRSKSIFLSCVGAIALSGCQLDLIDYSNRLEDEKRMGQRIEDMHPTAFSAIPESGTVSFQGYGNLYIDRVRDMQGDGIIVIGDANLTADFTEGTVTGAITNLDGATNVRLDSDNKVIRDDVTHVNTSGRIDIGSRSSAIGVDALDTARPNDWEADYIGTVRAGGENYLVDGDIYGQFFGTRVNNPNTDVRIKAIAGGEEVNSGSTATLETDGTIYDSTLVLVGEN